MIQGQRVFDTHTHIGTARHSGRVYAAEEMLRNMDRHGIDRSLLIPFPVVDDYRAQHDEIGAAVRQWPDRFAGAACLYPFVAEAEFRDEVRRCAEAYGFRALKLQPMYQPLNPVSARSDFFFEAALANGMAVVAHTGSGVPFSLPSLFIAAARRFPALPIVLGHAGGPLFSLECVVAAEVCANIYVEMSSLMPHHMADLLRHVPATRLMVGSDLPESVDVEIGKVFGMEMSEADRRAILWETGAGLFGG
ncbi:MAG: amidohydrolase family protein [Bryobacterales bacterium]|nr:amidohydrolase family protein [Bryobacterales bacterium]